MICPEYNAMTPLERKDYVGSLIHSVMSDGELLKMGQKMIKLAEKRGLFLGVVINPPTNEPDGADLKDMTADREK